MTEDWTYERFVRDALTRVPQITCEALAPLMDVLDAPVTVLDVREPEEWTGGVLAGAQLVPRGLIESSIGSRIPDRTAPIYVYCQSGKRSALAADVLLRMGYAKVFSLEGGIQRWRALSLPLRGATECAVREGSEHESGRGDQKPRTWAEVRREFSIVGRKVPVLGVGMRDVVYLDHAASTHAPKSVLRAYTHFLGEEYANVHRGTHLLSRKATERFDEAYGVVAEFIGANLDDGCVCFTQNTTQAIDLAGHILADRPGATITTEMEHHSNELPHRQRGPVLRCRVDDDGQLDLGYLEALLSSNTVKLVAVTGGSNITGLMPPIHQIARMAHAKGALILVDAAQLLARAPLDVKAADDDAHLDFVAAAGHKAYAPFGVGFLYGPRASMTQAPPYLAGGGTASQVTPTSATYLDAPDRHHGGTPNIAGVVGLAESLRFIQSIGRDAIRAHEISLTRRTMSAMEAMGGVTIYGPPDPENRLGVISFNVDGVEDLLTAAVLSEEGGLAVRNGRFCAQIYMERLLRTHHPSADGAGAVRASFGLYSDDQDVDRFLETLQVVMDRKWAGRYRIAGDEVSAEFAGRCADRWMEAESPR
ncbi:MAG: aminotransferase class V-fold PLP-dependent enzyme [Deltaproteobacteria bacterium]|nr:aminotransferase class V-fold PLP-dependent enzyme [Deltaproteobacteria bacterium]